MLDVVRVVGLLAIGIVVVGWLAGLFRNDTVVEPSVVNYAAVAEAAQDEADFPLAVPGGLPGGWRATSADWDPADQRWHVGILTEGEDYAGIEQSALDAAAARRTYAPEATEAGTVDVSGQPWVRLVDEQTGAVTLLLEQPESTVVVNGSAPEASLADLATRLHAGARAG